VRLEAGQAGFSEAEWPRVNISPEKHRAYAAQWFGMALALLLVFVFGGTNLREWWTRRRASRDGKH
ncbi:MAG: SURF1 family protein, partial [Gammaproteobacteria bacterium]